MSWVRQIPPHPGRYWWREVTPRFGSVCEYGIALVTWQSHYESAEPPRLAVRSYVNMGGYSGETTDHGGWSHGGGNEIEQWVRDKGDIEIWSDPVTGPDGLLPPLPACPDWSPPAPKPPRMCCCQGQAEHVMIKTCKTPDDEKREKQIADAKRDKTPLFECPGCSRLYVESELVAIRECPHCDDVKWNVEDNGNNCTQCNRPFSRLLTKHGCEDCMEECESFDTWPTAPEPTKKRKRAR